MGLKRIVARVEMTYPADDTRTLEELRQETPDQVAAALAGHEYGPSLAYYVHLNASVDPDPEPTLPDPVPDPREQLGREAT